jgi:hypothetical protein
MEKTTPNIRTYAEAKFILAQDNIHIDIVHAAKRIVYAWEGDYCMEQMPIIVVHNWILVRHISDRKLGLSVTPTCQSIKKTLFDAE